jgi:hypothetical protein
MSYGLEISKPGKNVLTAGLKDLILSSDYPVLKIAKHGTGSITYTHDGATTDDLIYTHDLEYKPQFRIMTQWFNIDTDNKETSYRIGPFIDALLGGAVYFSARAYVTTTELRYSVRSYTGSGTESVTLNFIYFLYYDMEAI